MVRHAARKNGLDMVMVNSRHAVQYAIGARDALVEAGA